MPDRCSTELCRVCGGDQPRPLVLGPHATHILAFEGESRAVWFEGNYREYELDRKRRLGAEAEMPHRIKYRKLVRA